MISTISLYRGCVAKALTISSAAETLTTTTKITKHEKIGGKNRYFFISFNVFTIQMIYY